MTETKPTYYTVQDVMELFGVKRLTVYRWIDSGKLKAIKTPGGRQWRIPKDAVQAVLDNQN